MSKHVEDKVFFNREIMDHYQYLLCYITVISNDQLLAADIVQDTMETVWKKLDMIRSYSSLKMSLVTIAKNKLITHYRKNRQEKQTVPLIEEVLLTHHEEDLINGFLKKEERRKILMTIGQLRSDHARILLMHYYYNISFREVAKLLNVNYNTVISWHRRALKHLGHLLEKQEKSIQNL